MTNLFTLGGDFYLNGRTYSLNVWGCVVLMLLSAVCGAATDLAFDARGYFWQVGWGARCVERGAWCAGRGLDLIHAEAAQGLPLYGGRPDPVLRCLLPVGAMAAAAQVVNCLFTAGYSLYMRGAMDKVAQHTSDGKRLGEFSMVGSVPR